jgi:hypothetical protein
MPTTTGSTNDTTTTDTPTGETTFSAEERAAMKERSWTWPRKRSRDPPRSESDSARWQPPGPHGGAGPPTPPQLRYAQSQHPSRPSALTWVGHESRNRR